MMKIFLLTNHIFFSLGLSINIKWFIWVGTLLDVFFYSRQLTSKWDRDVFPPAKNE